MKPREWSLNLRDGIISDAPGIVKFKGYAPDLSDIVAVIEHSAYAKAIAALKEIKSERKSFGICPGIAKRCLEELGEL